MSSGVLQEVAEPTTEHDGIHEAGDEASGHNNQVGMISVHECAKVSPNTGSKLACLALALHTAEAVRHGGVIGAGLLLGPTSCFLSPCWRTAIGVSKLADTFVIKPEAGLNL